MTARLMVNSFDPAATAGLDPAIARLVARREKVLGPSYKLFYERPVHVVRAEGVHLYGPDGTEYLDVYNNVPAVGHCHPHVVEAIRRQVATLNTHTRYLYDIILDYAEKLIETFPRELTNVMFTCTGSEASDLALRIAEGATGRRGLIVTANAYHGITKAVAEMSPSLGALSSLGAHVRTVPEPDAYRIGDRVSDLFAESVRAAARDLRRHGMAPAALVCDTIFSSDGIFSHPAGLLATAARAIRDEGGLFIADEVQPGFGRTGEAMWSFQRHGVVPDLVILGKPMGNGMPIAGVVARPELLTDFARRARYFNTFGGNPVSCAAGLAVLEVIERERLMENAREVGNYVLQELRNMAKTYQSIGDIRGCGLFIGVDFVHDRTSKASAPDLALRIVNGLRERRILISAAGARGNVLKIRPPLPFSKVHANQFLTGLNDVLKSVN